MSQLEKARLIAAFLLRRGKYLSLGQTIDFRPENFTVDTSLLPGDYQMLIEVRDSNGGGGSRKVGCSVALVEPER